MDFVYDPMCECDRCRITGAQKLANVAVGYVQRRSAVTPAAARTAFQARREEGLRVQRNDIMATINRRLLADYQDKPLGFTFSAPMDEREAVESAVLEYRKADWTVTHTVEAVVDGELCDLLQHTLTFQARA